MTTWFNSLNLRPQERRLVIGVLIGAFILLNVWFVWPHFGDWARNTKRAEETELKVRRYQNEVENISRYRSLIQELEQGGGATIAAAEQAVQFQKTIQEIANRSGVAINRYDPANPRRGALGGSGSAGSLTNSFFEESGLSVQMQQVDEKDLVLFLYNLGNGNSNIRVKELELSPHNTGTRLVCKALLIASYQKAPPAKSSQVAPAAARPGSLSTNNGSPRSNAAPAAAPATNTTALRQQPSPRAPGATTNPAPAATR